MGYLFSMFQSSAFMISLLPKYGVSYKGKEAETTTNMGIAM